MSEDEQWRQFVHSLYMREYQITEDKMNLPYYIQRADRFVEGFSPVTEMRIHIVYRLTNAHLFEINAKEKEFARDILQKIANRFTLNGRHFPTYAFRMFTPNGEIRDLNAIIAWYGLSQFTRNRTISIELEGITAPPQPIREPDITIHINNLNNTRIRRTGSFQQDLAQTRTIIDLQINPTATITDVYREVADRLFDDRHDISKIELFNTRRMMLPANSTLRDNHLGDGEIIYLWQSNAGDPPDYYPGAYAR